MKLSDLIEQGITKVPKQAFGTFFSRRAGAYGALPVAACVLGTALCAAFPAEARSRRESPWKLLDRLDKKLKGELYAPALSPETDLVRSTLSTVVQELNDEFHWPREKIAQWLRDQGR